MALREETLDFKICSGPRSSSQKSASYSCLPALSRQYKRHSGCFGPVHNYNGRAALTAAAGHAVAKRTRVRILKVKVKVIISAPLGKNKYKL